MNSGSSASDWSIIGENVTAPTEDDGKTTETTAFAENAGTQVVVALDHFSSRIKYLEAAFSNLSNQLTAIGSLLQPDVCQKTCPDNTECDDSPKEEPDEPLDDSNLNNSATERESSDQNETNREVPLETNNEPVYFFDPAEENPREP